MFLHYQAGNLQISGKDLRTLLGLRSTNILPSRHKPTPFIYDQRLGHGVGLSQYGADYMARQGSGYEEILLHYYTGTQLAQVVKG